MYSSMGCFGIFQYGPGTKIGRYCAIAEHSNAFTANHPMNTKSVHSFFYHEAHGYTPKTLLNRTHLTIGNDVFIGHHAIILPSVSSIGDGAIIGAGAIVHTDIPPYAVVVGHPSRIVRYRFSKPLINELLKSKWWEKSIDELLPDIESFQKPLENGTLIL
jgi:acetyltransferase-like isoleucine patch superfamily enzyme